MELPYANEIRILRASAERGNRARVDLNEVESVLTSLSLGSAGDRPQQLVARLQADWSEMGLEGEDFAMLTRARLQLRQFLGEGNKAQRELQDMIEHQWSHLKEPKWDAVRKQINDLSDRRATIYGALSPVATQLNALAPLSATLTEQARLMKAEVAEGGAKARKARIRLASLSQVVTAALGNLSTAAGLPDPPGPGNPDLEAAVDEFETFRGALEDVVERLQTDSHQLTTELHQVVEQIQAFTG